METTQPVQPQQVPPQASQIPQPQTVQPQPTPQPQQQAQIVQPQPQKSGGSCLKIFLIIVASCFVVIVIIFVLLTIVGIGAKKAIDKGGPGFAEKLLEEGIKKATGESIDLGLSGKMPEDFPSDVPVYSGSKVTASFSAKGTADQGASSTVMLTTTDSIKLVSDYYTKEIVANGWNITDSYDITDSYTITASKDSRTLLITIAKSGNNVAITLAISSEAQTSGNE